MDYEELTRLRIPQTQSRSDPTSTPTGSSHFSPRSSTITELISITTSQTDAQYTHSRNLLPAILTMRIPYDQHRIDLPLIPITSCTIPLSSTRVPLFVHSSRVGPVACSAKVEDEDVSVSSGCQYRICFYESARRTKWREKGKAYSGRTTHKSLHYSYAPSTPHPSSPLLPLNDAQPQSGPRWPSTTSRPPRPIGHQRSRSGAGTAPSSRCQALRIGAALRCNACQRV